MSVFCKTIWLFNGLLFDVEYNNFWTNEWGQIPDSLDKKLSIANGYLRDFPILIPIFSHCYIASEPNISDNPIFSVNQTDIKYYGYNLITYLANEFQFVGKDEFVFIDKPKRKIDYWSWFAENDS